MSKTATFEIVTKTSMPAARHSTGPKTTALTLAIRGTLTTPNAVVRIPINGEPRRTVHKRQSVKVSQIAKQLNARGHTRLAADAVYVWLTPRESQKRK